MPAVNMMRMRPLVYGVGEMSELGQFRTVSLRPRYVRLSPETHREGRPRLAARTRAAAADRAAREEAVRVVKQWNASLAAGQGTMWSPTIRAAVLAGMP
jgi:hypothetical protein